MSSNLYLNQCFKPNQQDHFVESTNCTADDTTQLRLKRLLLLIPSIYQQLYALNEQSIRFETKQESFQDQLFHFMHILKQIDRKSDGYVHRLNHQLKNQDNQLMKLSDLVHNLSKNDHQLNKQLELLLANQSKTTHQVEAVDHQLNHQLKNQDNQLMNLSDLVHNLSENDHQLNKQLELLLARQSKTIHQVEAVDHQLNHQLKNQDNQLMNLSDSVHNLSENDHQLNKQLELLLASQSKTTHQVEAVNNRSFQTQVQIDHQLLELEHFHTMNLNQLDQLSETMNLYYHRVIDQLNELVDSDPNNSSLTHLLQKLNPATPLSSVTIAGERTPLRLFVHFDQVTNLVTFVDHERQLLITDAHDINALQLQTGR